LERFGIAVPRLLAVGQRFSLPWRSESFVLTAPVAGTVPFRQWLRRTWDKQARDELLHEAGTLLRRLHEAGYAAGPHAERVFLLQEEEQNFVVDPSEGLERLGEVCRRRVLADLRSLTHGFSLDRAQTLRFLLGYHGRIRLREARIGGAHFQRASRPDGTLETCSTETCPTGERQVCA
jgi:hypothetical protein